MPEINNIEFSFKEIAEVLVRHADLHNGLWGIEIKFGIQGTNIGASPGSDLMPAAIVPVVKLGIQRFEKPSNLTVDASEINPE